MHRGPGQPTGHGLPSTPLTQHMILDCVVLQTCQELSKVATDDDLWRVFYSAGAHCNRDQTRRALS